MITAYFERCATASRPKPALCPAPPRKVIALFDEHEVSLRPWKTRGYATSVDPLSSLSETALAAFRARHASDQPACVIASPPCKNLCAAGARWWPKKRKSDPQFQEREIDGLRRLRDCLDQLGTCYCILLPAGGLVQKALGAGLSFDPAEFGGHAPKEHPVFPDLMPPHDAYKKRTIAYLGTLRKPSRRPVPPVFVETLTKKGRVLRRAPHLVKRNSPARNVVPLGFVTALALANCYR